MSDSPGVVTSNLQEVISNHEQVGNGLACTVLDSKTMLEHRLSGHSRFNSLCPECAQGKFKARQSFRKLSGNRANPAGLTVALDFTGPHPEGVSGGVYGLIGVEMEDEWGYVGIMPDKSASNTLKAIQDLECQMKIDSGKPS